MCEGNSGLVLLWAFLCVASSHTHKHRHTMVQVQDINAAWEKSEVSDFVIRATRYACSVQCPTESVLYRRV